MGNDVGEKWANTIADKWGKLPQDHEIWVKEGLKKKVWDMILESKWNKVTKHYLLDRIEWLEATYLRAVVSQINRWGLTNAWYKVHTVWDGYCLNTLEITEPDSLGEKMHVDVTDTSDITLDKATEVLDVTSLITQVDYSTGKVQIWNKVFLPKTPRQFTFLSLLLEDESLSQTREDLNKEMEVSSSSSFRGMANIINQSFSNILPGADIEIVFEEHQDIDGEQDNSDPNKDIFRVRSWVPLEVVDADESLLDN